MKTKKHEKICMVRRAYVTLLELLLVIAIMSLIGGIVAISVNRAVRDQRFRTEVSIVVDKLRLAQNLMLILNSDVHVKFLEDKDGNGIKVLIDYEELISKGWTKELKKEVRLKDIHAVQFEDLTANNTGKRGELDIRFLSGGTVMSRGILRLGTAEKDDAYFAMSRYICLPGYPSAINQVSENAKALDCSQAFAEDKEEERRVTALTVEEVPVNSQLQADSAPLMPKQERP